MNLIQLLLLPFSLLYAGIIFLRNFLYDSGWLRSRRGSVPALVVGNLSVGGTGKTPFSEYLIRFVTGKGMKIAFLSRGFGRCTRGYLRGNSGEDAFTIGDEPDQIASKFPDIPLAVCEERLRGIELLHKEIPDLQWIILDDAFQHRRLRPDFSVLLTDFSHPWFSDRMLPSGTLRDNRREKRRANVIVVTKCPADLSAAQREFFHKRIKPTEDQHIFFTGLEYGHPQPVWGNRQWSDSSEVLGFCGIARSETFHQYLLANYQLRKFKFFPDHHPYTPNDLTALRKDLDKFAGGQKGLLTTEKDARRIRKMEGWSDLPVFFLPVRVRFLHGEKEFQEILMKALNEKLNGKQIR
ncbi:MAG: tetraacyldisaccharide 4'-kinase [Crocinitomicaceae bacterium]|nr:tetraacyldisaccharide 4'-kinase [Crocinitomicaceae bacterium]